MYDLLCVRFRDNITVYFMTKIMKIFKNLDLKLSIRNIAYWFICLYSIIFIYPTQFLWETPRLLMCFGLLCAGIVFLEKLLWRIFYTDKDFEIKNGLLKIINSIVIVFIGKYTFPCISGLVALMNMFWMSQNQLDNIRIIHLITLVLIVLCSNLLFSKTFIKQNPYD